MKQLTCEMCGGTELVKQEGVFACQNCGTKYSVEEAKKMMVEGTVEVTGTVRVDNTANIKNFLNLAENANLVGNNKEAEDYCNRILEIDPENYIAWLLKGKSAGWQSTIAKNRFGESVSCFANAIKFVPENSRDIVVNDASNAITSLSDAMLNQVCNNFLERPSADWGATLIEAVHSSTLLASDFLAACGINPIDYRNRVASEISSCVLEAWKSALSKYKLDKKIAKDEKAVAAIRGILIDATPDSDDIINAFYGCRLIMEAAINISPEDLKTNIQRYNDLIKMSNDFTWQINSASSECNKKNKEYEQKIKELHHKIKELDPSYEIPKTGCYVATAVYGSYNCPQVWILRRFRDNTLSSTWYGRIFIRLYYASSPVIVKKFGHTTWFNNLFKKKLDVFIKKLNDSGVSDKPYCDE